MTQVLPSTRRSVLAGGAALASAAALARPARAATKITCLTSWFAQADHGGFYQTKATGLHEQAGLDVTVKLGGPQVNALQLLTGGAADIVMGYDIQVPGADSKLAYFRVNQVGRAQTLWRLRVPSALPFCMAGLRISSGLALIGAVVAEFVAGTGGRSAGLAYEILQSGFQLDISCMFAALLLITVTGLAWFGLMVGPQQLLLGHWHDSAVKVES